MFSPIRWRLVGWSMAVLSLSLALVGTAVYVTHARTLEAEIDQNLANRGDELALRLELRSNPRPQIGARAYHEGLFYLVTTPDGQVLDNPQQVEIDALPAVSALPTWLTVDLDDEPARLYLRPFPSRDGEPAVLVVGQSLLHKEAAQRHLLLVMLAGAALGLVLSFAGAWFLAGRALLPIELAFRRQREFVADASHELRTPLTALHAATDLLYDHRAEPLETNRELFDDVRREITRLERLTNDLLTLARADLGAIDLEVAAVDVGALAGDVVRRLQPLATRREVVLTARLEGAPVVAEADPDRLQQVLLILLDNALKHTPAGGHVTLTVSRSGAQARVDVSDSGEGIAPADLERVFDRFYRANRARSRANGGAGLGLAIAHALVTAHGGSLQLASRLGHGTTATIRLPLSAPPPTLAHRLERLATGVVRGTGSR